MEHRCTPRVTSDIKILISKHGLPIAIGRIRNGSTMGVFVETEFEDIDCEQLLTLEVVYNKSQDKKFLPLEMQALVIHKTQNGFGAEVAFASEEQAIRFGDLISRTLISINTDDVRAVVNQ